MTPALSARFQPTPGTTPPPPSNKASAPPADPTAGGRDAHNAVPHGKEQHPLLCSAPIGFCVSHVFFLAADGKKKAQVLLCFHHPILPRPVPVTSEWLSCTNPFPGAALLANRTQWHAVALASATCLPRAPSPEGEPSFPCAHTARVWRVHTGNLVSHLRVHEHIPRVTM